MDQDSLCLHLSKHPEVYESWKSIVKNYGFKWEKRTGLETVMNLLNINLEDVVAWVLMALKPLETKILKILEQVS